MISRSEKRCTGCGELKWVGPDGAYHRNRSTVDGYEYRCKVCISRQQRGRGDRVVVCRACQRRVPALEIARSRLCGECIGLLEAGHLQQCPRCRRYAHPETFGEYVQCRECRGYKAGKNAEYRANHTPPTERELVEIQRRQDHARAEAAWAALRRDRARVTPARRRRFPQVGELSSEPLCILRACPTP